MREEFLKCCGAYEDSMSCMGEPREMSIIYNSAQEFVQCVYLGDEKKCRATSGEPDRKCLHSTRIEVKMTDATRSMFS